MKYTRYSTEQTVNKLQEAIGQFRLLNPKRSKTDQNKCATLRDQLQETDSRS